MECCIHPIELVQGEVFYLVPGPWYNKNDDYIAQNIELMDGLL